MSFSTYFFLGTYSPTIRAYLPENNNFSYVVEKKEYDDRPFCVIKEAQSYYKELLRPPDFKIFGSNMTFFTFSLPESSRKLVGIWESYAKNSAYVCFGSIGYLFFQKFYIKSIKVGVISTLFFTALAALSAYRANTAYSNYRACQEGINLFSLAGKAIVDFRKHIILHGLNEKTPELRKIDADIADTFFTQREKVFILAKFFGTRDMWSLVELLNAYDSRVKNVGQVDALFKNYLVNKSREELLEGTSEVLRKILINYAE